MIFYFHIQGNHPKYTLLLILTAELPELYILTNSGIIAGKIHFKNRQKIETSELIRTKFDALSVI